MRWDCWILIFALALVLGGCKTGQPGGLSATYPGKPVKAPGPAAAPSAKPATVIVTPASSNVGKIASVNPVGRFVVITYPLGNLPAAERRLNVYRAGLKVAEVKAGRDRVDVNLVADIVAGECQPGDEVKED